MLILIWDYVNPEGRKNKLSSLKSQPHKVTFVYKFNLQDQ